MFLKAIVRMDVKLDEVKDDVKLNAKLDDVNDDVKLGARLVVVEVGVHEQFTNK